MPSLCGKEPYYHGMMSCWSLGEKIVHNLLESQMFHRVDLQSMSRSSSSPVRWFPASAFRLGFGVPILQILRIVCASCLALWSSIYPAQNLGCRNNVVLELAWWCVPSFSLATNHRTRNQWHVAHDFTRKHDT